MKKKSSCFCCSFLLLLVWSRCSWYFAACWQVDVQFLLFIFKSAFRYFLTSVSFFHLCPLKPRKHWEFRLCQSGSWWSSSGLHSRSTVVGVLRSYKTMMFTLYVTLVQTVAVRCSYLINLRWTAAELQGAWWNLELTFISLLFSVIFFYSCWSA